MITERQVVAKRTTWFSIGVNIALVCLQLSIGLIAHSQALVADGIHALSDLVADGIVLFASKRGGAQPDDDHNYGHSRYETVASLFLGAILLAVGAGMLWRAGMRLTDFGDVPDIHLSALCVAVIAILAKEGLFRYMLREAERVRSSLLIANAWHARSDAASSLVVGLGILGSLLGYKVLDPIAASIVGFMIARMGWTFGWNALQDLSDRALDDDAARQMEDVLRTTPGVREVHGLKTRKMGDSALVDAHLLVNPRISVSEGHYIAESARARLKRDPRVLDVMVHIDPENDASHQATSFGLPMRPELLARARDAFARYGIPVEAIDLHYLNSGIDLDVFIHGALQDMAGQTVVVPDARARRIVAVSDGGSNRADGNANDAPERVAGKEGDEALAGEGEGVRQGAWSDLDLPSIAVTLGVRQVRIFLSVYARP